MDNIFDESGQQLFELINIKNAALKIIKEKGINTSKMRAFLERYIDEEKIRSSGKDFGLVTLSIYDKTPLELMINDIPRGQLVNYLMASSSFPGFQHINIDGNAFADGGLRNNCPFNLLRDRGYDEIIVIRTHAPGIFHEITENDKIDVISAQANLGSIMMFTPENSAKLIERGYYDGFCYINDRNSLSFYP
jgi:NTE family protein